MCRKAGNRGSSKNFVYVSRLESLSDHQMLLVRRLMYYDKFKMLTISSCSWWIFMINFLVLTTAIFNNLFHVLLDIKLVHTKFKMHEY